MSEPQGAPRADVVIVDLGLGNLRSVQWAFERAGASAQVSSDADLIVKAQRVVVPGQGAFRDCSKAIQGELGEALREVLKKGTPYFGICLGMQVLFDHSEEAPGALGLGFFKGQVRRFRDDLTDGEGHRLKVPHMGWNLVEGNHPLLGVPAYYYFVHSFFCEPADQKVTVATAEYGAPFCVAAAKDHVFACQFHPEKSQRAGEALIRRFTAL